MGTHNVQLSIDDTIMQAAQTRAEIEGKTIDQLIAEFVRQYAAGASSGVPTTYTVQRGDTLGRIAARFYGDARKYPLIQRANNIANPSRIWVGQVMIIPPITGIAPAPAPPPTLVPTVPSAPGLPSAPRGAPQQPSIRWVGSPNFNNRRRPDDITAIIIHSTANSSLERVVEWFNNPSAQVSAHYTIGKDGAIVQHVQDMHRAWHAGRSAYKGRQSCNDFAIGIELVNLNDGADPYPESQHQANVTLCVYLCRKYNISPDDIIGHLDIAIPPGRKSDPRGYDMHRLRRDVVARQSS
jgi:N-acetylmuramoyl-L-alanine amidase